MNRNRLDEEMLYLWQFICGPASGSKGIRRWLLEENREFFLFLRIWHLYSETRKSGLLTSLWSWCFRASGMGVFVKARATTWMTDVIKSHDHLLLTAVPVP